MAKPKRVTTRSNSPTRRPKTERWWGVRRELEHFTQDEDTGAVYRPDLIAWITSDGKVRASSLVAPDVPHDCLVALLKEAEQNPMPGSGSPCRAEELNVEDETIGEVLMLALPERRVVLGETNVADTLLAEISETFGSAAELPHETFAEEDLVTRAAVRQFLDAFERFYTAVPWEAAAESELPVLRLDAPSLGVDNGCLVIFSNDQERGVSFFMTPDDLMFEGGELPYGERPLGMRSFVASAEVREVVPHERLDDLTALGVELDRFEGWCPGLSVFDYDEFKRPLVPADLRLATLCLEALAKLLRTPGAPVAMAPEVTLSVQLQGESAPESLRFTTPHPEVTSAYGDDDEEFEDDEVWDEDAQDLDGLEAPPIDAAATPIDHEHVRALVKSFAPTTQRTQGIGIPLLDASKSKAATPRADAPCPCGSGKRYKDCHLRD